MRALGYKTIEDRCALIEQLAAPIKYARVHKLVTRVEALFPLTAEELEQVTKIGENTKRWEPARISFYRLVLETAEKAPDPKIRKRLITLLKRVRKDLVARLSKSNNYPTARMYIDALRSFQELTTREAEQIVATLAESPRLADMRLEARQFVFFRDLLATQGVLLDSTRLDQLVHLLKTAVEQDPSLQQL